jgi:FMN phosphatase YigB (HAD superfamily)
MSGSPPTGALGMRRLPVRAVLFDVDGTLYHQKRLRLCMAAELGVSPLGLRSIGASALVVRVLRTYRNVHEEMRNLGRHNAPLAEHQIRETAYREDVGEPDVRAIVSEWMTRRPLKYLRWCRRSGLVELLQRLQRRGVLLGVLSDYQSHDKLAALDVARFFTDVCCTTEPDINALKPHPRGFLQACDSWNLSPDEVLYVGDRPEIDGAGALAAGLQCALFAPAAGRGGPADGERNTVFVRRCEDLAALLLDAPGVRRPEYVASGFSRT